MEVACQIVGLHPAKPLHAGRRHAPRQHQIHQHIPQNLPQKDSAPLPGKCQPHNSRCRNTLVGQLRPKWKLWQQQGQARQCRSRPRQNQTRPTAKLSAQQTASRQQNHRDPAIGQEQNVQVNYGVQDCPPPSLSIIRQCPGKLCQKSPRLKIAYCNFSQGLFMNSSYLNSTTVTPLSPSPYWPRRKLLTWRCPRRYLWIAVRSAPVPLP